MPTIGYGLFSEEHSAADLVTLAGRGEQAGFAFATLSDHYQDGFFRFFERELAPGLEADRMALDNLVADVGRGAAAAGGGG